MGWVNELTRGWVSESGLLWVCSAAALVQAGGLLWVLARLWRAGADQWPSVSVLVPSPDGRLADVAPQSYAGALETVPLGPGGWPEALARVSPGSELILLASGSAGARPGWAAQAVAAGPTHLLRFLPSGTRWEEFPRGIAGLMRLVRVPERALYVHVDGPLPPPPPAPWPGRLTGQARKWGVYSGYLLQFLAFGPLLGAPFQAYALFWSLRGRGAPTLLAFEEVLLPALALGAAAVLRLSLRRGLLPGVRASGERMLRPVLDSYNAFIWRRVSPFVPPGSRFVDVGAASGLLAEIAGRELGVPARAVDVAPWAMGSVPVEWYDGERIPLGDKEADVAVCVTVLHHCDDPVAVLKELRRVARRLVIVEDRGEGLFERFGHHVWHRALDFFLHMPYNHDGFRGLEGWRERLAAAGFRIVDVREVPYHLVYSVLLLVVAE